MKYGLTQNTTESIQTVFSGFPEIDEVIIYGSRAKGNYKPGSDIDLALKGERLNLSVLNKISLQLDELYLPYIFDLSVYNHIQNEELLDHIKRIGICFYKKNRD